MNDNTLLLRQVHPSFVQEGKVTSQVFRPTPKDQEKLSVYNGDKIDPSNAWAHFIAQADCHSAGILAVNNLECVGQELSAIEDAVPFPEHCTINFSGFSKSQIEKKAKILKSYAETRGWLYQP